VFSYDKIKKHLVTYKTKVVFIKKDGTERTMICTLNMDNIPKEHHPKGLYVDPPNHDIVKAFDLEKNGWRSFRVDAVKSIEAA